MKNKDILILVLLLIANSDLFSQINTIAFNSRNWKLLEPLKFSEIIKNVTVIGIGEATHGDHESQLYRKAIIEHCITEEGFEVICLEEIRKESTVKLKALIHSDTLVDRYTIENAILKLGFWLWWTDEFVDIIQMLNRHNLKTNKKVDIYAVSDFNGDRDTAMANRICAIESQGEKVIYLAHNLHVSHEVAKSFKEKWAGNYLKERLGNSYYAIGLFFNTGRYNAWNSEIKEFKTFQTETPSNLSFVSSEFKRNAWYGNMLDIRSLDTNTSFYKGMDKYDYYWLIGASSRNNPKWSYLKNTNIARSFDGLVMLDSLNESGNFKLKGHFTANLELIVPRKDFKKIGADSIRITFTFRNTGNDSMFYSAFYTIRSNKKEIYYYSFDLYESTNPDVLHLPSDSIRISLTVPVEKKAKNYTFGFIIYNPGTLALKDFVLSDKEENKKLDYNFSDFEFWGEERYTREKISENELMIVQIRRR